MQFDCRFFHFVDRSGFAMLENPLSRWIFACALALLVGGALLVLRRIILTRFRRLAERTETLFDDHVVSVLEKTRTWFLAVVALFLGSQVLQLGAHAVRMQQLLVVAVFLQVGLWSNAVLGVIIGQWNLRNSQNGANANAAAALLFIGRLLVWTLVLLLMLDNLGG